MMKRRLKEFLDRKAEQYNQPFFIQGDPVSVPHAFSRRQDIEIAGFFAAIFSWGNRVTIIRKSVELMQYFQNAPYEFCLHHTEKDLRALPEFSHRTFNSTDLLYFIEFLRMHYSAYESLEPAFTRHGNSMKEMLNGFHHYFFSLPHVPARTRKHIATPERKSSCKRLNMFMRWMVRRDNKGVDFGIWENISPAILICPIDLHVARVAKKLGLLQRKQADWAAAEELTSHLRAFDPDDPVRYDFALFGLGMGERF
jgi:uncharacterized protein (TIGR02757 family)